MAKDPVNHGYAQALFEMARAENVLDPVEKQLLSLRELIRGNPDLLAFLKDQTIKRGGKRQALAELFETRVHPLVLNLLLILSDQERTHRVLQIIDEFRAISSAARQKLTGEVVTAFPLDGGTLERLAGELSRITGSNVQLFEKVDPSVLGGVILKAGDLVIDGSLRRKLEQIKERITS